MEHNYLDSLHSITILDIQKTNMQDGKMSWKIILEKGSWTLFKTGIKLHPVVITAGGIIHSYPKTKREGIKKLNLLYRETPNFMAR